MDLTIPAAARGELAAAYLQAVVTLGLAGLCAFLWVRYRKPYYAAWAAAWGLFALRLGVIISFLYSDDLFWLYAHQVFTGWTALALLWAALVFALQLSLRRWMLVLALFPPLWSYVAIYELDNFLLAALPAVLFLSGATLWTALTFLRHRRRTGSSAAALLGMAFLLWSLHHLDYPFLRARGVWNPWGYYLDLLFVLAVGTGILLLVQEDLHRGLRAITDVTGDLQRGVGDTSVDALAAVLERMLTLPGVRGAGMVVPGEDGLRLTRGHGVAEAWTGAQPPAGLAAVAERALTSGDPVVRRGDGAEGRFPYTAALPVSGPGGPVGALVLVGDARDPFTALDSAFLRALGQQVGTALETQRLYDRLQRRTAELERLQARMVHQHEEERRRLSRELHDETAQVLAAVKMQLGMLREQLADEHAARLDRSLELMSQGIQSIRDAVRGLRPAPLDDLGLAPALQALARDFTDREALDVDSSIPDTLPPLPPERELALYRALQEGLANVARHAAAEHVQVRVAERDGRIHLVVSDDGRGLPPDLDPFAGSRTGLAGLRERVAAAGGRIAFLPAERGATLEVILPVDGEAA